MCSRWLSVLLCTTVSAVTSWSLWHPIWSIDPIKPKSMKHLISVDDMTLSDIERVFGYASHFKLQVETQDGTIDLQRKILISYFEEASTRTSTSFHAAMLRLGGQVINIHEDKSSRQKGESIEDTIRTLCSYGDILVIRHSNPDIMEIAKKVATKPIINAGKY